MSSNKIDPPKKNVKIPLKNDKKKKRIYLDPLEFYNELVDYIMKHKMDPNYVMPRKLGSMIVKLVDEIFNKANFRNYYNGWKYEMKSRAFEHICKYAVKYNMNFAYSCDFFFKWMYRVNEEKLTSWFEDKGVDYVEFKENLPEKEIKTPNGEKKTKIVKYVHIDLLLNLFPDFNEVEFTISFQETLNFDKCSMTM